tara:strand:- start:4052 stop:6853 length:2802 start_codon:yes stop_codon:yes gene_type:complete
MLLSRQFPKIINASFHMGNKIKYLSLAVALALTGCGGSGGNKAPEFTSSSAFTLSEDSSLIGQLTTSDDDSVSYSLGSAASNGLFSLNADGSFSYTPKENFAGQDTVTVTATDGNLSTDAVLTFTINNVNDAPTLASQSISVTTSTTTEGTLTFNDVDGDTVTVSLVTPPTNGTLTLDEQTGAFTFTAETLSEINDSFVIEFTDGIISSPISATIELKPSYVTNEDKLNYYYSSDKSHLKQAEAIGENINDDVYMSDVNAALAIGYLLAGFDQKAIEHFDKITTLSDKANAYRLTAQKFDALGVAEQVTSYRDLAVTTYNQYIASIGVENLTSSDAAFYSYIANEYKDSGEFTRAAELYKTLELYADSVRQENYTTVYGRLLTAFSNASSSAVERYLAEPNETNKALASEIIKTYGEAITKTGYQYVSSGEYKGEKTDRLKSYYVQGVIELSMQVNDIETAKYYANYALSLFGHTGFDSNYSFSAATNSAVTLATYQSPLEKLTAYIGSLYDIDFAQNPAFNLISTEKDQIDAREKSYAYQIANKVIAGFTVTDAIADAKNYFIEQDNNNVTSLYWAMADGTTSSGAASIVYSYGYPELGLALLDEASKVMFTEAYFDQQSLITNFRRTGWQGCARHISLDLLMGSEEQAKSHALQCTQWMEANSGKLSTEVDIEGYSELIRTYNMAGINDEIPELVAKMKAEIDKLENPESKIPHLVSYLGYLNENNLTELAVEWVQEAITLVSSNAQTLEFDDFTDLFETLYLTLVSTKEVGDKYFVRDSFFVSLAKYQSNNEQYANIYQSVHSKLISMLDESTKYLLTQEDKIIQDNVETYVSLYTRLGQYSKAEQLINLDINAEADKLALYALQASLVATKDDFPGSTVASVDTDNDGKPNFFLSSATPDAISDSGLTADTDADNDGIEDSLDTTPLGE